MADMSLEDLKAKADASRAAATAATAEATARVAEIKALLRASQDKENAARLAEEEVEVALHKQKTDAAWNDATALDAKALDLESAVNTVRTRYENLEREANVARIKAKDAFVLATRMKAEIKPAGPFVFLEGGGFAEVQTPFGVKDAQVMGVDGSTLDHVSDLPSGAWVYRRHGVKTN